MADIYSVGSVTTKNALWVAISSTVAAICLFTSVMAREADSTVETGGLEGAVDALVERTAGAVDAQEKSAQGFVDALDSSLVSMHDAHESKGDGIEILEHEAPSGDIVRIPIPGQSAPGNCERIDDAVRSAGSSDD